MRRRHFLAGLFGSVTADAVAAPFRSGFRPGLSILGGLPSVTQTFTAAQVTPGIAGTTDPTTTAGLIRMAANSATNNTVGLWVGQITGSSAYMTMSRVGGSAAAGMIEISVDGGAFAAGVISAGSEFILFTGLLDAVHTVVFRPQAAYGTGVALATTGNLLRVVGTAPALFTCGNWQNPGDASNNAITTNALITQQQNLAGTPTNVVPAKLPDMPNANSVIGGNTPILAVRGAYTTLAIATQARYCFVSVDNGTPTRYDLGLVGGAVKFLTGLSGTHTYTVWAGKNSIQNTQISVGGVVTGLVTPSIYRLDQYGDSITYGAQSTTTGDPEYFAVAVALGRVAGNFGISGNTTAQLAARLPSILAEKVIGANDVAVIAIGRNDGAPDATWQSNYSSIITNLLNAGYVKVLCRAVLPTPTGSQTQPTINTAIQAQVTSAANPKVVFVDTSTWWPYASPDATHPTDAGYVTLNGFEFPAYQALGL
jgi:lysophospholipase L1-like esterase